LGDWGQLLAALDLDGPTRMLAQNCALAGREPGVIRLTLDPRHAAARTRAREEKLAQALAQHFGETVRVEIEMRAPVVETPAQSGERQSQEVLAAARAALQAEPTVQALQQRFGATIHAESVRPRKPA
jgi:DNA polymerase-3 subunit gamma/tau